MLYLCPQITKTRQDMEIISIERSTYEVIGLPLRLSMNCWRVSIASSQRWRRWLNEVTIWQPNSFTNPPQFAIWPKLKFFILPRSAFISGRILALASVSQKRLALIFQNRFAVTSFFRNFGYAELTMHSERKASFPFAFLSFFCNFAGWKQCHGLSLASWVGARGKSGQHRTLRLWKCKQSVTAGYGRRKVPLRKE